MGSQKPRIDPITLYSLIQLSSAHERTSGYLAVALLHIILIHCNLVVFTLKPFCTMFQLK